MPKIHAIRDYLWMAGNRDIKMRRLYRRNALIARTASRSEKIGRGAKEMTAHRVKMLSVLLGSLVFATDGHPCSITGKVSNVEMVNCADAIVRATAVEYAAAPSNPKIRTTGVPDSTVRFKVIESIRGPMISDLVLPGYLTDGTTSTITNRLTRLCGRAGSCFANSFRSGGPRPAAKK
jgi:hypothetical protein